MSDTVTEEQKTAQEAVDQVVDNMEETPEEQPQEQPQEQESQQEAEQQEEEKVPLSALKKVRKEAKEAKLRAELLNEQLQRSQQPQQQNQVDNSDDLLTVGQSKNILEEWKRSVLEEAYMEQHPDIVDRIENELPDIVNRHKWLADSLKQAPNRLHRAKEILEMFKPKKEAVPPPDRSRTPKAPQSVAKTNNGSIAERIMKMSDQELEEWRLSQKRNKR